MTGVYEVVLLVTDTRSSDFPVAFLYHSTLHLSDFPFCLFSSAGLCVFPLGIAVYLNYFLCWVQPLYLAVGYIFDVFLLSCDARRYSYFLLVFWFCLITTAQRLVKPLYTCLLGWSILYVVVPDRFTQEVSNSRVSDGHLGHVTPSPNQMTITIVLLSPIHVHIFYARNAGGPLTKSRVA